MTRPTDTSPMYEWHRRAIAGLRPQITTEPQLGWYKRRLVRSGPWVPARVYLYQDVDEETGELIADEELRCEVNGKPADPVDQWLYLADQPIAEAEFHYMTADVAWCEKHAPASPAANPQQPISTTQIPPLF